MQGLPGGTARRAIKTVIEKWPSTGGGQPRVGKLAQALSRLDTIYAAPAIFMCLIWIRERESERAGAGAVIATILWSSPRLLLYYSEKSAENSRVDFH